MTTQEQEIGHGSDPKRGLQATRGLQPGQRRIRSAAILAAVILSGIAILQVALAAGAPWGGIAWGGVEEGRLPGSLRVASAVAAVVLTWMMVVLLTRGGVMPRTKIVPSRHLRVETWAIAVAMALNTLGNLASGNPFEQVVFAPATAVLTTLAVYLAVRGVQPDPEWRLNMDFIRIASLILALVTVGMFAGVFGLYSNAIMPGLRRTNDRTFVGAFQAIDTAVINPLFLSTFFGGLVFSGLALAVHLGEGYRAALPWLIAAFVLYLVVVVATLVVNVPLNDGIKAVGDPDRVSDLAVVREQFNETRWLRSNHLRTILAMAAFGSLAWALVLVSRVTS